MKLMIKSLLDIFTTWTINLMILLGISQIDTEALLKNAVLTATLVWTIIKITSAIKQWRDKNKKDILKEED